MIGETDQAGSGQIRKTRSESKVNFCSVSSSNSVSYCHVVAIAIVISAGRIGTLIIRYTFVVYMNIKTIQIKGISQYQ